MDSSPGHKFVFQPGLERWLAIHVHGGSPQPKHPEIGDSANFKKFDQNVFFSPNTHTGSQFMSRAAPHRLGAQKSAVRTTSRISTKTCFQPRYGCWLLNHVHGYSPRHAHPASAVWADFDNFDQNVFLSPDRGAGSEFMSGTPPHGLSAQRAALGPISRNSPKRCFLARIGVLARNSCRERLPTA